MGVTKVRRDTRAFAQLLVHRHLTALFISHAQAQRQSNAQQLVRETLQHIERTGWFDLWQLDQHQQSACALHQRAHCAAIGFTLDEVTFPVARELAVFNPGGRTWMLTMSGIWPLRSCHLRGGAAL